MAALDTHSQALRTRAHDLLAANPQHFSGEQVVDAQTLIQELSLYQLELGIQNEDLRQTQRALEESRSKYADLYDFAPIGYLTLSAQGIIEEINLTGAMMLGRERQRLIGRAFSQFVEQAGQAAFLAYRRQLGQASERRACELTICPSRQPHFAALFSGSAVFDEQGQVQHYRLALLDVTARQQAETALHATNQHLERLLVELRQTQAQLVQHERLAAVGQLTAGIAHEFNNILTAINGFAELLLLRPNLPETARPAVSTILAQGQQAAGLVRQLVDFSGKSLRQLERLDLALFCQEVVRLLKRIIPANIDLLLTIAGADLVIEGDRAQIQQVLTNLVINAQDAMPDGGQIRMVVANVVLADTVRCLICDQLLAGEWVLIRLADSGHGIPPAILPHILEPFFTTKPLGVGTGLGLSQVAGLVAQHGGHLSIDSTLGLGTTFLVYLPPSTKKPVLAPVDAASRLVLGNGETILLVEDDDTVREISKITLEELHYVVLTAVNGSNALAVYAEHRDKITLVLSDMVMPEMGGAALWQRLKAQNPAIKMVMMSGYPLDTPGAQLLEQGLVVWLQKPMAIQELSQVLSRVIRS